MDDHRGRHQVADAQSTSPSPITVEQRLQSDPSATASGMLRRPPAQDGRGRQLSSPTPSTTSSGWHEGRHRGCLPSWHRPDKVRPSDEGPGANQGRADASRESSVASSPLTIATSGSDHSARDTRLDDRSPRHTPSPGSHAQALPSSPASVTHFSLLSSPTATPRSTRRGSDSGFSLHQSTPTPSFSGRTNGHLGHYLETIQSQDTKGGGYLEAQETVYDKVIREFFDIECDCEFGSPACVPYAD
jgi:hypothetical protein